ncbi:MAG: DUF2868 domain-containing protein [Sterolibacteriaceae bacterium]|uniref:DUF2868 domain-containing protein n=1 Tax=Candidatus Methylophosphatis roskildensis TaxID=2899263 RepID=A0A9D7E353_9PROT|nr:DUF2868 domain-containing protein [Candidatus Methylophosphatis roskildensis]
MPARRIDAGARVSEAIRQPWQARWLAEALRLGEEHEGPLEDSEAVRVARAAGGDFESRVLRRAAVLGRRDGLDAGIQAFGAHTRKVLWGLALVGVLAGAGVAVSVLGDGTRPVNVVWAIGGLLGVHLLTLFAWVAGAATGGDRAGSMLGQLWLWASRRMIRDPRLALLPHALAGMLARARLLRWWLGTISHGVWALALLTALSVMLLMLSTRRYEFVWETTILPAKAFVQFANGLGWLPAQLGFPVPSGDTVRASGMVHADADAFRRLWSGWLIGGLVAYGIAPRLLLWSACLALWRKGRAGLRLDLDLPGYAALRERLVPASERIGVCDAAPESLPALRHPVEPLVGEAGALALGIELGQDIAWPPALPAGTADGGLLESREQRNRLLGRLAQAPVRRLLIVCDARLSPDRGSLALIAELARYANRTRVCLAAPAAAAAEPQRVAHWREGLLEAGVSADSVSSGLTECLAWLEAGDD